MVVSKANFDNTKITKRLVEEQRSAYQERNEQSPLLTLTRQIHNRREPVGDDVIATNLIDEFKKGARPSIPLLHKLVDAISESVDIEDSKELKEYNAFT